MRVAIERGYTLSCLLWGPPGTGKTTLARIVAQATKTEFVPFSAVLGGVRELRAIIGEARERRDRARRGTTLFVDEIHRFNKSQQDAFLPHVESGLISLIGATTENPSFELNAALLSRLHVYILTPLTEEELIVILRRALEDPSRGLGQAGLRVTEDALRAIAVQSDGDARRALNLLDSIAAAKSGDAGATTTVDAGTVRQLAAEKTLRYDRASEEHFNTVSALIKSLRGSDPDAAIYWLARMVEGGEDPRFICRRLVIFASEDVGNADPRALQVAVAASHAV